MPSRTTQVLALLIIGAAAAVGASPASAHCDGLDGPVVGAARTALENGDAKPVLIWVQRKDEDEIRAAFNQTLAVRKLGPEARNLADRYFFETLVRVHRAGEGAPYTGLKSAGRDLGPAIPAADAAIADESAAKLVALLADEMQEGLRRRFKEVVERKKYAPDDIAAGRAYVEAYVPFIHYVERLYEAAARGADGHFPDH